MEVYNQGIRFYLKCSLLSKENHRRSFQKDSIPRFFKQFRKKEFSFFSLLVSLDPENVSET
ncbi:hypothetical protein LEP1GSC088_0428 [Leptospira interrogans str. L1207]|nr:hypothetical protein LEP1GSC088_0428 [Leptospira interrogans str. L1207]